MIYHVTNDFTKINETSGTVQNTSSIYTLEMGGTSAANSGILIYPLQMHSFSDTNIFIRCVDDVGYADVRVVPFELNSKGGDKFDFSLDQLGTTFINDFTFSALAYPNTADPQLDGKPVLVMSVKDNNDKSQDVKYVFVNLESLMVHYEDFAGAGVSAAGMSGMVPAPQVGDQDKFLCGNGTWETINTGLDAISLTLGNVPTFKIIADNGVEFAADLYPAVDTLVGDTLYFDKHIFQFTGLSSGLTLHDSNFYAASDSACENSFGSIVAAPNDYSFCFSGESAFDVEDGGVISVTQLDANTVNLSLNLDLGLDELNVDSVGTWGLGDNALEKITNQTAGKYIYTSSSNLNYLKTGESSYTYSTSGVNQQSFTLDITQVTNFTGKQLNNATTLNTLDSALKGYVSVEERRNSDGNIAEFVITILSDIALKEGNTFASGGTTINEVGKKWTETVTATVPEGSNIKTTIKLGGNVTAASGQSEGDLHTTGTLTSTDPTTGTYTFQTDAYTEGYYPVADDGGNIYLQSVLVPTNGANGDTFTISGLATDLTIQRTGNYQYNILNANNKVVGTIARQNITITSENALLSGYKNTDDFTVTVTDTDYDASRTKNYWYTLNLDSSFTNYTDTLAKFTKDNDDVYTYHVGKRPAHFEDNGRSYLEGNSNYFTDSFKYVKEQTLDDAKIDGTLTITGLAVLGVSAAELQIDDGGIYKDAILYTAEDTLPNGKHIGDVKEGTKIGSIDAYTKNVSLYKAILTDNPPSENITITLGGDNDYKLAVAGGVTNRVRPYSVWSSGHNDAYDETGYQNPHTTYGWADSDDGKSIFRVAGCGMGVLNVGRPTGWWVMKNESDKVFWTPDDLGSASAIKVADFDGETITINHNVLDNRSLSSPLVLKPFYGYVNGTLGNLKLDLATDNETAAIARNFAYETFTAGASAGTYTYAALSSTEGWDVSADEHQILSVELEGKTFTLNNLRTDLGNLGFDSQGYIHATNGSTIGRMRGTGIKLFDTAVHKLATPTITGTDAADFTLILPT